MQRAINTYAETGSTVLVVSKGDDDLVALPNRTGWHFPRLTDGTYTKSICTSVNDAVLHGRWNEAARILDQVLAAGLARPDTPLAAAVLAVDTLVFALVGPRTLDQAQDSSGRCAQPLVFEHVFA